jgi:hypothetical protein
MPRKRVLRNLLEAAQYQRDSYASENIQLQDRLRSQEEITRVWKHTAEQCSTTHDELTRSKAAMEFNLSKLNKLLADKTIEADIALRKLGAAETALAEAEKLLKDRTVIILQERPSA